MNAAYETIFKFCGYLCHQMPERSFFVVSYQFPLCFRCTGLLLGTLIFMALIYARRTLALGLALLLTAPMVIDVGLQAMLGWQGHIAARLLTGIGAGAGLPAMMLLIIASLTDKSRASFQNNV